MGALPHRDPGRHDRLHRHRDDLEHGRGGQGRGDDDPGGDQPRAVAVFAIYFTLPAVALSALPVTQSPNGRVPDAARRSPRRRAATRATRSSASSSRSTSGRCRARRALRRPARGDDPVHRDERGDHRRLAARLLDGHPPPAARRAAPAAPELPHAVDRDPRLRRRRDPDAPAGPGRRSSATSTRSARCCRSRSRTRRSSACASTQPDFPRPYRGPGNVRFRGRDAAAVRARRRLGTALAFLVDRVLNPDVAIAGFAWLALGMVVYAVYRRRQGLDLTLDAQGRDPAAGRRPRGRVRLGARARRRRRLRRAVLATAIKLAARKRRGIHVLVTITGPELAADRRAMPEERGGRRLDHRAGQAAGRPARVRATGRRSAPGRPGGGSSRRRRTCARRRS